MASGRPMSYLEQEVEHETAQVVGYTGHFPGDRYSIGQTSLTMTVKEATALQGFLNSELGLSSDNV